MNSTNNRVGQASREIPLGDRRHFLLRTAASIAATVGWGSAVSGQPGRRSLASSDSQAGSPNARFGLNLTEVTRWMTERPFINLFETATEFVPISRTHQWNQGGPVELDRHGWPQQLKLGESAAFVLNLNRSHPNTLYQIRYDGPPDAVRAGATNDAKFQKNRGEMSVVIFVTKPVRDISIVEAGARTEGALFHPTFVDRCRQFSVLRMMGWNKTNHDREVRWETRVTPDHFSQGSHEVALEYMIQLCNLTSSGLWYCVHHRADDEFVRNAAQMVQSQLDASLPVYLEHSNEVWNPQFPQHAFCQAAGNPSRDGDLAWLQYHAERTARAAALFRDAGRDVVSVLGMQAANTWIAGEFLKKPISEGINAIGIAPYFGGRVGRLEESIEVARKEGLAGVFRLCREDIRSAAERIETHRGLAEKRGLSLVAYEGGQHLVAVGPLRRDQGMVDLLIAANRHPEMYQLYRDYLQMWNDVTDSSLMCLFESMGGPSQYGSWGLMEFEGQALESAHKYRAVIDALTR